MKTKGDKRMTKVGRESGRLNLKDFLKALGVGIGVIGIGVATGGNLLASNDTSSANRADLQRLMRGLLHDPAKASSFLDNPHVVAEDYGVRLTDYETGKIREGVDRMRLAMQRSLRRTGNASAKTLVERDRRTSPQGIRGQHKVHVDFTVPGRRDLISR